jgi:hypothetical protein
MDDTERKRERERRGREDVGGRKTEAERRQREER